MTCEWQRNKTENFNRKGRKELPQRTQRVENKMFILCAPCIPFALFAVKNNLRRKNARLIWLEDTLEFHPKKARFCPV